MNKATLTAVIPTFFLATTTLAMNEGGRIGLGVTSTTLKGDQATGSANGFTWNVGGFFPLAKPTSNWQMNLGVESSYLSIKNTLKDSSMYHENKYLDMNINLIKIGIGYNFVPNFWLGLIVSNGNTDVDSHEISRSYSTGGFGLMAAWDVHKNVGLSLGYDAYTPNLEKFGDKKSKFALANAYFNVSYIFSHEKD